MTIRLLLIHHSGMKAIVFTEYGSPDNLELRDVAKPVPGRNDVLIRVHASSVNSWDWEFLNGVPFINRMLLGLFRPKQDRRILGGDVAGTVEKVGADVTRFKPGDAVFGDLWDRFGGFAEYACAPEIALERKPGNISFEQAACVPQAGVLALQGVLKAGQLGPGQKVLINGAGGGVGTFAIQLAKQAGANVTAVDAAHKLDTMRAVGADAVLDYRSTDFTKTGARYDLIIDCQCRRSMVNILRALELRGTYAFIGGSIPRVYQMWMFGLWLKITGQSRTLCLVAEGPNKGLAQLRDLIEAGKLVPVIDRTYALSDVPEAMRYFGQGQHKGKIAITVAGEMAPDG
ncbi:NAD(P)-dependent alcohol dehydrogenase [Arenibacterium sp. CAU 1754]